KIVYFLINFEISEITKKDKRKHGYYQQCQMIKLFITVLKVFRGLAPTRVWVKFDINLMCCASFNFLPVVSS
ncbi:MAG: hypothetical protein ACOCUV_02245, partial [bacterium]